MTSSIGRALHQYRRGHGFESRSSLNFLFRPSFRNCLSCVYNCDDHSLIHSRGTVHKTERAWYSWGESRARAGKPRVARLEYLAFFFAVSRAKERYFIYYISANDCLYLCLFFVIVLKCVYLLLLLCFFVVVVATFV